MTRFDLADLVQQFLKICTIFAILLILEHRRLTPIFKIQRNGEKENRNGSS